MGHIRGLSGRYSLFGFSLCVLGMAAESAGGRSTILRQWAWLIGVFVLLAVLLAFDAEAQSRGSSARAQGPALPSSGHQSEPVDLNEGKSPAELFKAGCAVCHQSAAGLAKGRREGELVGFLRQHYTSSVQHAGALAHFLAVSGRSAPAVAAPSRQAPAERPPAPVGRRAPPDDDRRETARPEPASKRKPPVAASRTPPPTAAAEAAPTEPEPEPAAEPSPPAAAPPAEEKPPAPEIPL